MTERLSTGNARLDKILRGGLPTGALNLIVGLPGAGKTMLVQQCVFANATEESPTAYFATVSEPFDKIVRYGQTLSFFDTARVGTAIIYDDLGPIVQRGGLQAVLSAVEATIRNRRPGIVVIDSFRALRAYAGEEEFRGFLHDLAGRASAFPASHFWIGEYTAHDMNSAPAFAVADAVIALSSPDTGERTRRELEVLKLRGSDFLSGKHAYRLSEDGLEVFPRLADPVDEDDYVMETERQSSGIQALDAMIGDGYLPGTSILLAGPTGVGKTVMGLHFIFNGALAGKPGLMASLQEDDLQLTRVAKGFGWSFEDPNVSLMYASPVDLYVDEWVYALLDRAEEIGAQRIVIDSVDDLSFSVPDSVRFREYLYSLSQRCARRGIALMMTMELSDLFDVGSFGRAGKVSHMTDTVVLMQYVRDHERLDRALTVLKSRATPHQPQTRRYSITSEGILLGDPITPAVA
jgi:circadian clock protein KaiC